MHAYVACFELFYVFKVIMYILRQKKIWDKLIANMRLKPVNCLQGLGGLNFKF